MNLQRIFKKITDPILDGYHKWYHKTPRVFHYKDLNVNVLPEVFSPISSNTTTALLRYVELIELKHKTVLELGCGTGILSLLADKKGGIVTASDINDIALKELTIKAREENRTIITVYSDLLENLHFHFDFILINPPYIPENPLKIDDSGIMCGVDFQYFDQLFKQLRIRSIINSTVLMVLPETAELFAISRRASANHLKLITVKVNMIKGERIVVYQIVTDG